MRTWILDIYFVFLQFVSCLFILVFSRQEALSSAVSEKDAHLQWLEVTFEHLQIFCDSMFLYDLLFIFNSFLTCAATRLPVILWFWTSSNLVWFYIFLLAHCHQVAGEGSSNAHTRGTLERLRRERRDLLNRMKEEVSIFCAFIFCSPGWRRRLQNQFLSFFGLIRWRESLQNQFVDQCDRTNRFFSEREPPGVDLCSGRDVFSLHGNRQDLNSRQPPSRRVTCKWRKCFFSPRAPRSLVVTSFYVFSWTRILQGFNQLPRTSQPAPKRRFLLKHIFKLHACSLYCLILNLKSTVPQEEVATRCPVPLVTCPRETHEEDEDNQSSKSFWECRLQTSPNTLSDSCLSVSSLSSSLSTTWKQTFFNRFSLHIRTGNLFQTFSCGFEYSNEESGALFLPQTSQTFKP